MAVTEQCFLCTAMTQMPIKTACIKFNGMTDIRLGGTYDAESVAHMVCAFEIPFTFTLCVEMMWYVEIDVGTVSFLRLSWFFEMIDACSYMTAIYCTVTTLPTFLCRFLFQNNFWGLPVLSYCRPLLLLLEVLSLTVCVSICPSFLMIIAGNVSSRDCLSV